jgi:hypothetical protein
VRTALPRASAHAALALHLPDDQRASAAYRLADDQFSLSEKLGNAVPENGDPQSV